MLNPDTTVLLTEALHPPPGFEVDTAVATTYSLDLTAMLIAPMTFAFSNVDDARHIGSGDPVQMLDAVKRHIGHTTVFCQAAAIHVPPTHSRIHAFLEDSIFQVEPPAVDGLFHPKVWALRYVRRADGALHHRVVVASRNLTLDSSWDTALVLDEDSRGAIEAAPAADFIAQLPALCTDPLPETRAAAIDDLCTTLRPVRLEAPYPFTGGELLPLGLAANSTWPFAEPSDRILAISPFLSASTLGRLRSKTSEAILLSRAESLDQVGGRATSGWDLQVLSSGVDLLENSEEVIAVVDEFASTPSDDPDQKSHRELTGLHAKTVVTDHPGGGSRVVTGSANITAAAWHRNIEFDAVLTGPTSSCGVEAVLGRESNDPGLQKIMESYSPAAEKASEDPTIATSYLLESFHRKLARSDPRPKLDIIPHDDSSVSARLTLTLPDELPGKTKIWLSTVPGQPRRIDVTTTWDIAIENITPFIAIETTAGSGVGRLTRRCLIMVPIIGDPLDRRQRALADMLNSSERVLRYLAFLLGIDEGLRPVDVDRNDEGRVGVGGSTASYDALSPLIVLFEPIVRAVSSDIDRLASVADQVAEIRALPDAETLIPPEFLKMWDVVLNVVSARRTT